MKKISAILFGISLINLSWAVTPPTLKTNIRPTHRVQALSGAALELFAPINLIYVASPSKSDVQSSPHKPHYTYPVFFGLKH